MKERFFCMDSLNKKTRLLIIIVIGFVLPLTCLVLFYFFRNNSPSKTSSYNIKNEINNDTPDIILTKFTKLGSIDEVNFAKLDKKKVKILFSYKINDDYGLPIYFCRIYPDNKIEHLKKIKHNDYSSIYLVKQNIKTGKEISSRLLLKHDETLTFNHIAISQDGKRIIIQDIVESESGSALDRISKVYILDIYNLINENDGYVFTSSKVKIEKKALSLKYKLIKPEIVMPQIWNPKISKDGNYIAFFGSERHFNLLIPDFHSTAVTCFSLFVKDINCQKIVKISDVDSENILIKWLTDNKSLIWTKSCKSQQYFQKQTKNVFVSSLQSNCEIKTSQIAKVSYNFSVCFKNNDLFLLDESGISVFKMKEGNFQKSKRFNFDKSVDYIRSSDISLSNDKLLFVGEKGLSDYYLFMYDLKRQKLTRFAFSENSYFNTNWYHKEKPNIVKASMIYPMDIIDYPLK